MMRRHARPIQRILLLVGAAIAIATFSGTADSKKVRPENLLANPGFEELNPRGFPTHWRNIQHAGVRSYEFRVDRDVRHEGSHSMRIQRLKPQVWAITEQIVPISPESIGKTAILEIWQKGRGLGPNGSAIHIAARSSSDLLAIASSSPMTGDQDWTLQRLRLEVPESTVQLAVWVSLDDEGTVWIDDAHLRVVARD